MSSTTRTDKGHEITYPSSADARGSTRINLQRRPYYMGPFESPQSYIMFGLWKHRLMKTGSPPETKELRPLVDRLLAEEPLADPSIIGRIRQTVTTNGALLVACLTASILVGSHIVSSNAPAAVDGQTLTSNEEDVIRGLREHNLRSARLRTEEREDDAVDVAELLKMGPKDGKRFLEQYRAEKEES